MSLRIRLALLALLFFGVAFAGCGGGDSITQIVVVVDTSEYAIPSEIDRVVVTVYDSGGDTFVSEANLTAADTAPRTVGVVLESGRLDGYVFEIQGRQTSAGAVVEQRAVASFVSGETRYLHVTLHALCEGVSCCGVPVSGSCTEVETCMPNGLCGSADVVLDTSSSVASGLDEAVDLASSLDAGL